MRMTKKKNKLLSYTLVTCMLFSTVPAFAASVNDEDISIETEIETETETEETKEVEEETEKETGDVKNTKNFEKKAEAEEKEDYKITALTADEEDDVAYLTLDFVDDSGEQIYGVTISLKVSGISGSFLYDADEDGLINIDCEAGTYTWEIYDPDEYYGCTGSFDVTDDMLGEYYPIAITLSDKTERKTDMCEVTVDVVDESDNPVIGFKVTINGNTYKTDENGMIAFTIEQGIYTVTLEDGTVLEWELTVDEYFASHVTDYKPTTEDPEPETGDPDTGNPDETNPDYTEPGIVEEASLSVKITNKNGSYATGVQFEVFDEAGNSLGTFRQSSSVVQIGVLPVGTYKLLIETRNGYNFSTTTYEIELKEDMIYTIASTNTRTSSGGSGGGSSHSISSSGSSSSSSATTVNWNYNSATGKWTLNNYRNQWVYVYNPYASTAQGQYDWFHFDASGYMDTGWFVDVDGNTYYLNPVADGTQGRMLTGWQYIDGQYYYFNEYSNGTKGALYKNTITPDGHYVNEYGMRIS